MGGLPRSSRDLLTVLDVDGWRRWLETNQDESAVWLVFHKKHTGTPGPSYDEAVEEALCVGWIDSLKKRLDDDRYTFKFTPRRPGSSWSPSNKRRIAKLHAQGRLSPAVRAMVQTAKQDGSWDRPTAASKGAKTVTELRRTLEARNAQRAFAKLPPSHRRQYNAWIASAKKPETRERRAHRAVDMMLRGQSPSSL